MGSAILFSSYLGWSCLCGRSSRPLQSLQQTHKVGGFTLVEVLLVIAVLALLGAAVAPALSGLNARIHMRTAVDQLHYSLMHARSEAIKRRTRVVACKSSTGLQCIGTGGWDQGWIVFHDSNNNAQLDANESILERQQRLHARVVLSGNQFVAKYVSYTPLGNAVQTNNMVQNGTFTACVLSNSKTDARQIVLSGGRPRIVKTTVNTCQAKL